MSLPKRTNEYPVKLFRHGGSQAARLPKELRINAAEAIGCREGDVVLLRPAPVRTWPKDYWDSFGPVGDDFKTPEPLPSSAHRDAVLRSL
jgi:antitoxin VapB